MTGTCSWWLLLVALLPLIFIAPVYCQHPEEDNRLTFLVAIKNNESGLEVHTLSVPENRGSINILYINNRGANQRPDHELKPQMLFIPGHNLSSECGEQYFRCQELSVETVFLQGDGGVLNIVFVPLEKGILLLNYWYDSNYLTLTMEWNIYSSNCNPIVFYKISGKFYVVCIGSYEYFQIAVYEIKLNLSGSIIEDVILTGPLNIVTISNSTLPSSLSNFILVEHTIYFAVDNTIIDMDVFDSTPTNKQYPELLQCTQIHKLVPTLRPDAENKQLLVVYCTDKYFLFDPFYGDWIDVLPFSSNGIPYLCPDNNYTATLFIGGTLQTSVQDSISSTIDNVNISSGVCFESQNRTYFAYSDQQHNRCNIYVYDFITQSHYSVSPCICSLIHQDCPRLLVLDNQYLEVHDEYYNFVLNAETNFSLIINISSGIADILAILHGNTQSAITPSPPVIHSTTTAKVPISINITSTFSSIPTYTHVTSTSSPTTVTLYSTITATGSPGNL